MGGSATNGTGATGGAGGNGGISGGTGGMGGNGDYGGTGGAGGEGGTGTGGDGGNGGLGLYEDGATGNQGGSNTGYVFNAPEFTTYPGEEGAAGNEGADGADGNITVTIQASISGNVVAVSSATVNVTLAQGAAVGGTISVDEDSDSTLTFQMEGTQKEFNALNAMLNQGNGGSIVIGGQTYSWSNFDKLANQIQIIVAQAAAKAKSGSRVGQQGEMIVVYDSNHNVIFQISEQEAMSRMAESGPAWLGSASYTHQGMEILVNVYINAHGNVFVVETWPDGSTLTLN